MASTLGLYRFPISVCSGCFRYFGSEDSSLDYLQRLPFDLIKLDMRFMQGFDAENPWEHWANSGADANGDLQNGWLLVHADKAARIPQELSETPYMTRRAMDFIGEAQDDGRPWCLHLSYIKPHWPYIAPEPYASMYGADDVKPAIRSEKERQEAHPVFAAYMDMRYSRNMARDEAREKVIPAYMGLITQIDDQMGVLMRFLEARGLPFGHEAVDLLDRDEVDAAGDR